MLIHSSSNHLLLFPSFVGESEISFVWVLHLFQHCTGHITTANFVGRGKQYTVGQNSFL